MKRKTNLSKRVIKKIFDIFFDNNPTPAIELNHSNPFTLLVAVVLSAQCTDKMVNRCTEDLFKICQSPQDAIKLGEDGLKQYISRILFANNKSRNIIKMSNQIIENHNGIVPNNFDDLVKLAGVGRKSADVVLNSAFNKHTIAVDRHIFRIVHTIGITEGKDTDQIADNLMKIIPKKYIKQAHHWLVLHGRYICKARKRLCDKCPISQHCKTFQNEKQTSIKQKRIMDKDNSENKI